MSKSLPWKKPFKSAYSLQQLFTSNFYYSINLGDSHSLWLHRFSLLNACVQCYRSALHHREKPKDMSHFLAREGETKTGWYKTMGRAKEQHKLLKLLLLITDCSLFLLYLSIFSDGRKICSNPNCCLVQKII